MAKKTGDKYIIWLSELGKDDIALAGGKGANLGEMYNSGMPVPQAFVVSTLAYSEFLVETGLKEKIQEKLESLDEENTEKLNSIAEEIRKMILAEQMPKEIEEEILESYENISIDKEALRGIGKDALAILSKGFELTFVAVRSSATAEDSSETSFAGQNETFLNVKGKQVLLESVKKCWASLFTSRSLYYQIKNKIIGKNILIAVIVQQMLSSDKSGVIFSHDPINENNNIVIEAVFGLGEGIVSGKIKPDHYVVDRNIKILESEIANKKIALIRNSAGETQQVSLTPERSNSQVLTNYEIKKLADYAIQLEEHYGKPQDIEFAIDAGVVYIVQTRPITTLGKSKKAEKQELGKPILQGLAASPGIASGKVKIIEKMEDLKKIQKGDILVTKMTNPDMVVSMQKSAAIVTNEGGITSHASIVSREMGIPAIVGTDEATEILQDGQEITVDGGEGKVYAGAGIIEQKKIEIKPAIHTQTKIKVIVDLPSFAERASKTGLKEVGLTRIEGIIAESGKHPYIYLKENKVNDYEEIVYSGVSRIAKYFDKLWVRTSDIRTDEYSNLPGAPEKEGNPMLGLHGIRDSLLHPKLLKAELSALDRVAKLGKEIGILMPQLISVDEFEKVKEIVKEIKSEVEIGVMIETPASVEIIEQLCQVGIAFISFGTNDLTQYTLAIDRNNEDVQYLYDEMNPAILSQLARVIKVCKKYNVETSICGQAGSSKPMAEFLVKQGIDSISVNADKAEEISKFVAELEEKGLRGSELEEVEEEEKKAEQEKQVEPSEENKEKIDDNKPAEQEEFPIFETNIDIFQPAGNKETTIKDEKEQVEQNEKSGSDIELADKKEFLTEPVKNARGKYDVICSHCGNKAEVPFEPDGVRPVYCKECYKLGEKGRERLMREQENKEKIEQRGEYVEQDEESREKINNNKLATEHKNAEPIEEHFYVEDDDIAEQEMNKAGLDIY